MHIVQNCDCDMDIYSDSSEWDGRSDNEEGHSLQGYSQYIKLLSTYYASIYTEYALLFADIYL